MLQAYFIFALGNLRPIFDQLYGECFKTHTACSRTLVASQTFAQARAPVCRSGSRDRRWLRRSSQAQPFARWEWSPHKSLSAVCQLSAPRVFWHMKSVNLQVKSVCKCLMVLACMAVPTEWTDYSKVAGIGWACCRWASWHRIGRRACTLAIC